MAEEVKQRMKLLKALGSLGEDPLLEELIFHLQGMTKGLGVISEKLDNLNANTSDSEVADSLIVLGKEMKAQAEETSSRFEAISGHMQDMANSIGEFPKALEILKPKDIDFSPVAKALSGLPGHADSERQSGYLIKISDAFIELGKKIDELKTPNIDTGHKQITGSIVGLEKKLIAALDGLGKQIKVSVTTSSAGTGGYDLPPNIPSIQNITLTSTASEYPVTIPPGTKRMNVKIRGLNGYRLLWGWTSGDIITNNKYMTLEQGETNLFSGVRFLHNTTIYLNCPDANSQVAEVETWTS